MLEVGKVRQGRWQDEKYTAMPRGCLPVLFLPSFPLLLNRPCLKQHVSKAGKNAKQRQRHTKVCANKSLLEREVQEGRRPCGEGKKCVGLP